jgi:chaperone BCS1
LKNVAEKAPQQSLSLPSWKTPASRLEWIMVGAMGVRWLYQKYREKHTSNRDTILKFSPDDTPYYWLLRWLETMPRQQSLSVFRVLPPEPSNEPCVVGSSSSQSSPRSSVPVMVPTEGVTFTFRDVKCHIERGEPQAAGNDGGFRRRAADLTLRIESRDPAVAIALLEEISRAGSSRKEVPRVYVFQWSWVSVRNCPTARAAILPAGEYESLRSDLRDFFDSESWYRDVGLPYRRGFLFHGIPGSGKTTAVIALAGDFGLNVCVLSLSTHTDETLLEAVRAMPGNSILLLEDIDCAWSGRESKDEKRLTFSGLLNVLDGAATPEGRVAFMTTNKRDALDDALIRPGRVDHELEFRYAEQRQIEELAKRFGATDDVSQSLGHEWSREQISMAQVQERLIQKYRRTSAPNGSGPVFDRSSDREE